MAARKIRDAVVATGSYTDAQGQTKNRYENVGGFFKSDDGNSFLLLKRTFNPAGAPVREGSDSVLISFFELQDRQQGNSQQRAPARTSAPAPAGDVDDDIPF